VTAARLRLALVLLIAGISIPGTAGAQQVPVPDGYRMGNYRAPVPARAPGATTVDTAEVRALIAQGNVVLIDVLPRPPRPAGLPETTIWAPKPRQSLPGAVWIPNVGFGALSDEMHRYFSGHLDRLTTEMPGVRLVIFCEPNCWMSWNAVKRAADWGYQDLFWYPEGTEGWKAAGLDLEPVEPEPALE
jgi:PQQ-dependent catabolism-associated CXXCW motif protein